MPTTVIPAQRIAPEAIVAHRVAAAIDLATLIADYLTDGTAGLDAAVTVGMTVKEIDPLALLRKLGDTDLNDSGRLGILVAALRANLEEALAVTQP